MDERLVKTILFDALEQEPGARADFVARACGGDAQVERRVLELLDAHAEVAPVLATGETPIALAGRAPAQPSDLKPGDRVDGYVLEKVLGEGGFGTVYLARQEEPVRRRVALKVLKLGMDSRAVIDRFEAERQALAIMDHPNIARVLDAGATGRGRPYFVMELVDGEPITDYCEKRGLDTIQRVELFRLVCQTIQHAHQKGILHRDIKPSNVMVGTVDGRPTPKVIDFGIAKALDPGPGDRSWRTREGQFLGTPAYMSPEQAAGEADIDTRSDVYALGVLLYQLLTGAPPFELETVGPMAWAEILRRVREEDPRAPSQRQRMIERGEGARSSTTVLGIPRDLDWITLRALHKDREQRYPTAFALALDIERFLDHLPVEAGPAALGYRLKKLARRHRMASLALAGLALAVLLGFSGLGIGLVAARRAEAEARRQAEIAGAINAFLNDDLLGAVAPSSDPGRGRDLRVREVLDLASLEIEAAAAPGGRFHARPLIEAAIRVTLGETYSSLGLVRAAEPHLVRATALRIRELGEDDPSTLYARERLAALRDLMGQSSAAEALFRGTLDARERQVEVQDDTTIESLRGLGVALQKQAKYAEAQDAFAEALRRARETRDPNDPVRLSLLVDLSIVSDLAGNADAALELMQEVVREHDRVHGPEHVETLSVRANLGTFLQARGRLDEAEALLAQVLPALERLVGPDHWRTVKVRTGLATVYRRQGRLPEASALIDASLAASTERLGEDHPNTLFVLDAQATLAKDEGRWDDAEVLFQDLVLASERVLGEAHSETASRRHDLANIYFIQKRYPEARDLMIRVAEDKAREVGREHPSTLRALVSLALISLRLGEPAEAEEHALEFFDSGAREILADDRDALLQGMAVLIEVYLASGRYALAEELAREAVELRRAAEADPRFATVVKYLGYLGNALAGQERFDDADEVLGEALAELEHRFGFEDPKVRKACLDFAKMYEALGAPAHAEAWHAMARP